MSDSRNSTVDYIKGLCILFVILMHYTWKENEPNLFLFHYWCFMAVPVFMMVSGYIWSKSFSKRNIEALTQSYAFRYIFEKLIRFTVPFAIAFIVEILYVILVNKQQIGFVQGIIMFITGGIGQGSYYYPIMIQMLFLFPFIYFLIKKTDYVGLIISFAFCMVYEALWTILGLSDDLFRLLIFRYVFPIAVGCYICIGKKKPNLVIRIVSVIIGGCWLTLINYLNYKPHIVNNIWAGTSYIAVLWIIPFISFILRKRIKNPFFELLGKASYNIFLTQMVAYSFASWFIYKHVPYRVMQFIIMMILSTVSGIVFYFVESKLTRKLIRRIRAR